MILEVLALLITIQGQITSSWPVSSHFPIFFHDLGRGNQHVHHLVTGTKPDPPDSPGIPSRGADILLREPDSPALPGGKHDVLEPIGEPDLHQFIVLVKDDGLDTDPSWVGKCTENGLLHGPVLGGEDKVVLVIELPHRNYGIDLLTALQGRQHVHEGPTKGIPSSIRDLPYLEPVDPSVVGEEHEIIMGIGSVDIGNIILLPCTRPDHALPTALLRTVGVHCLSFDVTLLGHGEDHGFVNDEVLDLQITLVLHDLRAPAIPVFPPDLLELLTDDGHHKGSFGQDLPESLDGLLEVIALLLEGPGLQGGELLEAHLEYCLALFLAQFEPDSESLLGSGAVFAPSDDLDDLVDVLQGNEETFHDMGAFLCLIEIELRPPLHHLHAVVDEMVQHLLQGEDPRLVVHQGKIDDPETVLHGRVLVKLVEDDLVTGTPFKLDDDTHSLAVGLVPEIGDPLDLLILHQLGNGLDELGLVHHVGDLVHDEPFLAIRLLFDVGLGTDREGTPAGAVRLDDAPPPVNDATGWEIRAGNVFEQTEDVDLGILDDGDGPVHHLGEVVGGDAGGHAHGDPCGTVHQQVWELGGKHDRFIQGTVIVGDEIHGVLLDIREDLLRKLLETGFGVTHGRGRVTVH